MTSEILDGIKKRDGLFSKVKKNKEDRVDHIIKKASGKLSFLYRNHSFLDLFSRKLLCQTLIFSSLEYCATSWYSGLSCSLREALNVCQRC